MRVPLHIVEDRRKKLRELIRHGGFLPVAEICRHLGISEATARRDLAAVEAGGHITRTFGGALADFNTSFASHRERAGHARTAKDRIAAAAVSSLPSSGVVFLDAGTTIHVMARHLLRRRKDFSGLTVVTNSLPVATMLGGAPHLELHVLGGTYLHRQAVLHGAGAMRAVENWNFDAAYMGGEGFDADGVNNSHEEITHFQQVVLRHTRIAYFCLDATKLGRTTPHRVSDWLGSSVLITDARFSALLAAGLPFRADDRRLLRAG